MCLHKEIKEIEIDHYDKVIELLHESFRTVASEFKITEENSKNNAAFVTIEELQNSIANGLKLYGMFIDRELIGCVGIRRKEHGEIFEIEKLGVLPQKRHKGFGKELIEYASSLIKNLGGKTISIGIIDENTRLKNWYTEIGFREYEIKKIEYLPFTVCLMEMEL
jgi:diamine N-acetyltransferase